ncbi:MAG: adenosylcobinamide-GDP ribazoletransferase [Pseudomonadota bacterium]
MPKRPALEPFLIAVQFLTRLPVARGGWSPQDVGRSLAYYPAVGLLLGIVLAALAWLLGDARSTVAAAVILAVWVLATGALHLDGLADSADAWLGGFGDRERTLAIMKDPHRGVAAIVAVALVLIIKFAALEALLHAQAWPALLVAPLLGRASAPLLFLTTDYVRPGGLGSAMAEHLPRAAAIWAVAVAAVITIIPPGGIAMLLAGAIAFAGLRALMVKRIGGATGDTAGAAVELTEAAALVAAAIALS